MNQHSNIINNFKQDMAHNAKGKGTIFPYKCDLMNEIELKKTFYKVENQIGQIRVLVNSAGVASKPNFSGKHS